MTVSIRQAHANDLGSLAGLAAESQADVERYCAYFADDAKSIEGEIAEVVGPDGGDWTTATWIAVDDHQLVGWLLGETDPDMKRVWWWGPTLANSSLVAHDDESAIDRLFAAALAALGGYNEQEMAIDERSTTLSEAAQRHGLVADPGSVVLRTGPFDAAFSKGDDDVVPLAQRHHSSVIELHDELFAGTHTVGNKLVEAGNARECLVVDADVNAPDPSQHQIIGYVATEIQGDGSLYIDYLGVAPAHRGQGHGRRLVSEAVRRGAEAGASHAHLTVRADNSAARALYASLGFVDQRVVVPYRRGFSLK